LSDFPQVESPRQPNTFYNRKADGHSQNGFLFLAMTPFWCCLEKLAMALN